MVDIGRGTSCLLLLFRYYRLEQEQISERLLQADTSDTRRAELHIRSAAYRYDSFLSLLFIGCESHKTELAVDTENRKIGVSAEKDNLWTKMSCVSAVW